MNKKEYIKELTLKSLALLLILIGLVLSMGTQKVFAINETLPKLTLAEAIQAALMHNHNILVQRKDREKAKNLATRGNAGLLPDVGFQSKLDHSYGNLRLQPGSFFDDIINQSSNIPIPPLPDELRYNGASSTIFQTDIHAGIVLYDGGKGKIRYENLKTGEKVASLKEQQAIEKTILEVSRLYIQTALFQEKKNLQKEIISQSYDRVREQQERKEYGTSNEQKILQAKADLKSDSLAYMQLEYKVLEAFRNLHLEIGWNNDQVYKVDSDLIIQALPEVDILLKNAQNHNRELQIMEANQQQTKHQYEVTRAAFLPKITATTGYNYGFKHETDGFFEREQQYGITTGITISVPIYTGGRNRTSSQNARIDLKKSKIIAEQAKRQIDNLIYQLSDKIDYLERSLTSQLFNLSVYKRNLERTKESHRRGMASGLDLRHAQLALHQLRTDIVNTKLNLKQTETILLYYSGMLMKESENHF